MMELPPIPDKEFFSIGEASRIAQLPAYVLRYWESEFKMLRPPRRSSGQRKYTKKDLEMIFNIKDLLYTRKFTIAGAKKHLLGEKRKKEPEPEQQLNMEINKEPQLSFFQDSPSPKMMSVIGEAKKELEEILKLLK